MFVGMFDAEVSIPVMALGIVNERLAPSILWPAPSRQKLVWEGHLKQRKRTSPRPWIGRAIRKG